jgi:hypothetical protein
MSFNLLLPKSGSYKKATKDMIISILAEDYPLTIKQLFDKIRKQYELSVTYVAIRKSAQELVSNKVLEQDGKIYKLNSNWIINIRGFVDVMQRNYLEGYNPLERIEVGDNVSVYTVNSIYHAERIWGEFVLKWVDSLTKGSHIATFQTYHIWTVLFHLDWEERQVAAMREKNVEMYAALYSARRPTFLDKVAVQFYKDTGVPTQLVQDNKFIRGCEIGTYDDIVIQLSHPPSIAQEVDEFYARVRRLEDMNLAEISEIAKRNCQVKISVFKNAELANQIRSALLKHFPAKR